MNKKIQLLILFLSVISTCSAKYVQGGVTALNNNPYSVDLDLPYEERWLEIITKHKADIQKFWKYVESRDYLQMPISYYERELKLRYQNVEFLNELKAISKIAEVNFNTTLVINQMFHYEDNSSLTYATTIITMFYDGSLSHSRNFDIKQPALIAPLTTLIQFKQGGNVLYSANIIVGTIFAFSGFRKDEYSVSVSKLYSDNQIKLEDWQAIPPSHLIHYVLRTQSNYKDALKVLKETSISCDTYFFIAGVSEKQGAIIERGPKRIYNEATISRVKGYLVQSGNGANDKKWIVSNLMNGRRFQDFPKNALEDGRITTSLTLTTEHIQVDGEHVLNRWWNDDQRKLSLTDSDSGIKTEQSSTSLLTVSFAILSGLFII